MIQISKLYRTRAVQYELARPQQVGTEFPDLDARLSW